MKTLGYAEYERLSEAGRPVPVFREVPGDLHTPVSAFLALTVESERAFLLESVVGGERLARYSFLGRDPASTLERRDGSIVVHTPEGRRREDGPLPEALRRFLGRPAVTVPGLPRFTGGLVGYLTYDAVRMFERLPDRHATQGGLLASFSDYRSIVAFDHVQQRIVLIALAAASNREDFERAHATLDALAHDLQRAPAAPRRGRRRPGGDAGPPDDRARYERAVRDAQEHIACGDVYQVVLSRQRRVPVAADPFTVYRALRMVNPSPYMYFLKEGGRAVAGASPEMLVRVEDGRAETHPIAGTRPRGATAAEDERLGRELLADPKECAEHVMLVDLGRNDLGRVCRFESVTVHDMMRLERYSHVTHIASSVTGALRDDCDALDALVATFPAGTLSGAPKIRAMEIIDALEPVSRGLYGGALGYLDARGNLDFCIAIRTLTFEDGMATLQAGAGIVADSDPASEYDETEAKAGALLAALELAEQL